MRRILLLLAMMALTLLVASGVALAVVKEGGPGRDTLIGTNGSDTLSGKGGIDRIEGRGGKDVISGGPGNDERQNDEPESGVLSGGRGADVISGGAGDDLLVDGPFREAAVDTLSGGGGDDTIVTFNGPAARDIISCGAGRDIAYVDRKDIVGDDCERVELFLS
jgi:Ca2+-binding RTX toxin-like protein